LLGVGKLKQFRHVSTRYDKLDTHYLAFVQITSAMVWLRSFGDTARGGRSGAAANDRGRGRDQGSGSGTRSAVAQTRAAFGAATTPRCVAPSSRRSTAAALR
jgi:hypothetical protein